MSSFHQCDVWIEVCISSTPKPNWCLQFNNWCAEFISAIRQVKCWIHHSSSPIDVLNSLLQFNWCLDFMPTIHKVRSSIHASNSPIHLLNSCLHFIIWNLELHLIFAQMSCPHFMKPQPWIHIIDLQFDFMSWFRHLQFNMGAQLQNKFNFYFDNFVIEIVMLHFTMWIYHNVSDCAMRF